MTSLTNLTRLAEGALAIDAEMRAVAIPPTHEKVQPLVDKWMKATREFSRAANPQMVLRLLAVVKAAQALDMRYVIDLGGKVALIEALAALTSPTNSTEQKAP